MVLALFLAFLLFGCTLERDNPYDPYGINYDPSLYPSSSSSLSSSSLLAAVSSSNDVSDDSSSSSSEAGSSSSMPPVMVFCQLSDGICPQTLISQEACDIVGGMPVQFCAESSSSAPPSSSSVAPSSSSTPTFACTMAVTTGTVGVTITPAPAATCNGSTVTADLAWTPANLTPTTVGSLVVSVVAGSGVCSGMAAQCKSIIVFAPFTYGSLPYEGQLYKTIKIGTQTWMAENLNYNPGTGTSACYDNQASNCTYYGRLYDWSTAMGFASSCNSKSCWSQIQSPHQGICPEGWHIPSNAEWDKLYRYADGTSGTSSPYESSMAGKYLKATSGWTPYSGIENLDIENLDTYGFSALPGGNGYSDGSFGYVGDNGFWWSTDEYGSSSINAYYRGMGYSDGAQWYHYNKSYLCSVRCVQD